MRKLIATLPVVVALLFSAGSAWAGEDKKFLAWDCEKKFSSSRGVNDNAYSRVADYLATNDFLGGKGFDISRARADGATNFMIATFLSELDKSQLGCDPLKWFGDAAQQGDVDAQIVLGDIYGYGLGIKRDPAKALNWYHKAAQQGNPEAQIAPGDMSDEYTEMLYWYRKAARQGYPGAFKKLGNCYFEGYGVPQDLIYAHALYNVASAKGAGSSYMRERIAEKLTPEERQEAVEIARDCMDDFSDCEP